MDAVVGIYGRYDWEDRSTVERDRFVDFLERVVVKRRIDRHPEVFRDASPIARIHPDAPPFLVIHGSSDTVIRLSRHAASSSGSARFPFGGQLRGAAGGRSRI